MIIHSMTPYYVFEINRGRLTQVAPDFVYGRYVTLSELGAAIRERRKHVHYYFRGVRPFASFTAPERGRIRIGCQVFVGDDAKKLRAAALRASRYRGSR